MSRARSQPSCRRGVISTARCRIICGISSRLLRGHGLSSSRHCEPNSLISSLQAKRSNPDCLLGVSLDCFVAALLAMTEVPNKKKRRITRRFFWLASLVMPEQRQQQDDRQGNAKQPEQCTSSKTHDQLLLNIANMTQERRRSSARDSGAECVDSMNYRERLDIEVTGSSGAWRPSSRS